jgi:ankyrin repeat protein
LGKTTDVTTRRALRALFDSTSQAEQIERRQFSRLQQTVLELTHSDIELELKNAGPEEINSKDSEGNTVLSWAARRADRAATLALLNRGAEHHHLSKSGMSALHYAAGAKHPSCILPLLEAGAEVDVVNLWNETPLHVCALRQNDPESFMKPLLTYGADPNACDHEGSNVLSFAVQANHPQTVKYLLDYGVDMDIPDEGGLTSLGVAVLYNHHQILRMLLDRGADYTTLTMNRESILHLAAKNSDAETFSILGAARLVLPCDAVECDGLTPLECVRQRDDPELIQSFKRLLESLRDTHHTKFAPGSEKSDSEWETDSGSEVFEDSLEYQHPTLGMVPNAIAIFDDSTDTLVEGKIDANSNEIINPPKIWEC